MSIVLTGFMGCGKSTVAASLHSSTGFALVDTDSIVEHTTCLTVSEIFAKFGESQFRKYEHDAILEYAEQSDIILSLGGGAIMQSDNQTVLCTSQNTVFFIDTPIEVILKRLENDSTRPLISTQSRREIEQLFLNRYSTYKYCADFIVDGNRPADDIALEIMQKLL